MGITSKQDRDAIVEAQHSLGRPLPTQAAAQAAAEKLAAVGGADSFAPEDLEILARGIVAERLAADDFPSKHVLDLQTGKVSEQPIVVDPEAGPDHDCDENAVPYTNSGGPLGHGWECGVCGAFLQAG